MNKIPIQKKFFAPHRELCSFGRCGPRYVHGYSNKEMSK
jgi:hypothetical protein